MRGAEKNYRFGQKNHWRRTLWNEILRRTNGRERREPILYLAGSADIDRAIAVSKGVPDANLIAVEKNHAVASTLRLKGVPVIEGDLLDVLWSWSAHTPVAAVIADYCSGIENGNIAIYDAFERAPLRNAVIAINLMRGRDPWSNHVREQLDDLDLLHPLWFVRLKDDPHEMLWSAPTIIPGNAVVEYRQVVSERHRAYQFLLFHALQIVMVSQCGTFRLGNRFKYKIVGNEAARIGYLFKHLFEPRFFEYRSNTGALRMDSAVFQHHARWLPSEIALEADHSWFGKWKVPRLCRSIAARLAVRTRKLGGLCPES